MMEYTEFVKKLYDACVEKTGKKKEDIKLENSSEYLSCSSERLLIVSRQEGEEKQVVRFKVQQLYDLLCNGYEFDEIVGLICKEVSNTSAVAFERMKEIRNYESVKDFLFICPLNYDVHREELKDCVFQLIGDIALVVYISLGEAEEGIISAKVSGEGWKQWGKSREEIVECAMKNSAKIMPARFYDWKHMLFIGGDLEGLDFMNDRKIYFTKESWGNCISSTVRTNGAAALFQPGVAQRIAEDLGDFYAVFTSCNEVMVHSCEGANPEKLRKILDETMESCTPKEEVLTHHIYKYDSIENKFQMLPLAKAGV